MNAGLESSPGGASDLAGIDYGAMVTRVPIGV